MIAFLTSSCFGSCPDDPDRCVLLPDNRMIEELRRLLPDPCRALNICSDPDVPDVTDFYAGLGRAAMEDAGFRFSGYTVLDRRNADRAAELIRESDLIFLAGGHVPTQNRFFREIGLRDLLRGFDGVLIGISAGTMNSAETVYAQPEEEGEAVDPAYERFLPGLGLTQTMILPHYYDVKDDVLDGLRLIEDITLPDSMGRTFYFLPDGSYLFIESGREELRGEVYLVRDGVMRRISGNGDTVPL